ncbi:MAG: sulfatase [Sphingobacteriales bacterium]|jgi:alpha-L-rhamnosidase
MKKSCSIFLLFVIPVLLHAQSNKPNIIFILTDDHRWDALGFAGNPIVQTPQMDALANQGTYFTHAFSTTPICAASRASILTGLYERTHGYTFQKPVLKKPYANIIYPKLLKDNGYYVGFYGKLGVNIDSASQYFNQSDFYDRGTIGNRSGYFYKKIGGETVHLTRYTGHQAQEFIKSAPADKPFCLSLSFSAPHGHDNSVEQYFWQEKSNDLYTSVKIPEPLLGEDDYFNRLPKEVREGFNRVRWKWRFDSPEKYQQMVKGYYRMITEIDDEIGLLREQLRLKGIDNNTIIIVMGDNGYFLGDRQLADKWLMYDMSVRVPLIIFDPRVQKGVQINEMVLNIDITKTILDIAGINIPSNYQGESLLPFIGHANAHLNRPSILIEHLWPIPDIPSSEGIRTERWKYFRYRLIDAPEELYDLKNDPLEKNNLARDKKYAKILADLKDQLNSSAKRYTDAKLCPDDPFMKAKNF